MTATNQTRSSGFFAWQKSCLLGAKNSSRNAGVFRTTREREQAQNLPQSFAVRSIADFNFVMISSTSALLITKGGDKTIVSRIARQMRPSLKQ